MAVKLRGGMAIVQDPREAIVDSMPRSALKLVDADHIVRVGEIASILDTLSRMPTATRGGPPMTDEQERMETVIAEDFREQSADERAEETTVYTCPDCGGVLWQDASGAHLHFRCHVGHAYAPEILLGLKSEELEAALWSSIRLLREKATLTRQLAAKNRTLGNTTLAERGYDQAMTDEQHADAIRELLEAMPSVVDLENGTDAAVAAAVPRLARARSSTGG
jgi:two-component system chemotaxis response regulator CheB